MITALLLSIGLFGCSSDKSNDNDLEWFIDSTGWFHTTDIDRAQSQLCFPLLLPDYLPSNIDIGPVITGPIIEECTDSKTEVRITYQTSGKKIIGVVFVQERWNYYVPSPDPVPTPKYMKEQNMLTGVTEHEFGVSVPADGGIDQLPGIMFEWRQENIHLLVGVFGYDRTEAIKVIGSIINQN